MSKTQQPLLIACLALGALLPPAAGLAATTQRVAANLTYPVFVTAPAGDPRLFIVEQRGYIRILEGGQVLPAPFLDVDALVPNISGYDERGFLGLAFDPAYTETGRFYVNYTDLSGATVIARYHVSSDPDLADPGSAEILLTIPQPYSNHNGGTVAFGPDGYLYIGMGDGGSAGDPQNRAQTPSELLGKMLRIDVSGATGYTIPPDNPFFGEPGYQREIWALGVRNPYRFSFDAATGDLWIADVGQNLWEEIDFQPVASPGGENYGWRLMEGNHCYNPPTNCDDGDPILTYPIHEYSHSEGCSITGGYVYRGERIPALQGAYFFADFCSNTIWSLRYDGAEVTELIDRTAELAPGGGLSIGNIAAIGQDGSGELYLVDRGTGSDGEVYQIVPEVAGASHPTRSLSPGFTLGPGAPNPFATVVSFDLDLQRAVRPRVDVYDASGKWLQRISLSNSVAPAGKPLHLEWDGRDALGRLLPSGVYYVTARLGRESSSRSVRILR